MHYHTYEYYATVYTLGVFNVVLFNTVAMLLNCRNEYALRYQTRRRSYTHTDKPDVGRTRGFGET